MEWISDIFTGQTFTQAILILCIICAAGLALAKIRFWGISLGVTFVFFTGILAGHLGITINQDMLLFAQNFGLVIYIYSLGVQVGPGFFTSFKQGGVKLNLLATSVLIIGSAMAVALVPVTGISLPDMMGLLCGAVTNTPMLGAGQQTLLQIEPGNIDGSNDMALACAVGYPFGVIGVILAVIVLKALFRKKYGSPAQKDESLENTFVAEYHVSNPAIFGHSIKDIMQVSGRRFVISRVWKDGKVSIPASDTVIDKDDHLLVISGKHDVDAIRTLFGDQENTDWNKDDIDWNAIDSQLISQRILITRPELNGKKLGALKLRSNYGVNISRIYRSGVQLLASPGLRLQLGDRVTVVGEAASIKNVERVLGNAVKSLNEPNLISVFIGMMIGLIIGSIPFFIPGMDTPVRLGLAGGPVIVGILIGTFGPRMHMITYTTQSANLMLRALGLALYLACLGLDAGVHFFEVVMRPEGALWILAGFLLTVLPVLVVGLVALKVMHIDFGTVSGMLCGSMANPMALNYSNDTLPGDHPSVAYATVYPVCTFARVIIAQVVILAML